MYLLSRRLPPQSWPVRHRYVREGRLRIRSRSLPPEPRRQIHYQMDGFCCSTRLGRNHRNRSLVVHPPRTPKNETSDQGLCGGARRERAEASAVNHSSRAGIRYQSSNRNRTIGGSEDRRGQEKAAKPSPPFTEAQRDDPIGREEGSISPRTIDEICIG